MRNPVAITFRDQITGRINDLLMDEQGVCAQSQNLLGFLAGALIGYKDEGVEFAPAVVLCDAFEKLLKAFPGGVSYTIGHAALNPMSGPKILKDCGPLSGPNWFIFIERIGDGTVRYGVFTYFRLPTAISLHEGITLIEDQFCVLLRRASPNAVELLGAKGSSLTLIFSTTRESATSSAHVENFAAACCSGISDQRNIEGFKRYFKKLLESSLASSHGTIFISGKELNVSAIQELQDAVLVDPPIDFFAAFTEFERESSADSIISLQRYEELLQGFLHCDGMIAFDTIGRIIAYRVFFKATTDSISGTGNVVGGARRRAFEGVKSLVGSKLVSVLFRSQDGLTLGLE